MIEAQSKFFKDITMPRPLNKMQLLIESHRHYEVLDAWISTLSPEQMTRPGILGDWSVKDVLAHLHEWQQMFFRWYAAGLRGENPAVPADGYKWNQLPALNQWIYETYRNHPLEEILDCFHASHRDTIALIETLSDEALTTPGLYPWMNKNALMAYLAANTSSHYQWAYNELRKGLKNLPTQSN
jgi:hypothetical protein